MDTERFKTEILPLRERLVAHCVRILRAEDEAQDVVQEVFMKLWGLRGELNNYDSVPALATAMTKNICLNRLKSRKLRREKINGYTPAAGAASPHRLLEEKDDARRIIEIMGTLPAVQQAVLRMRHVDGLEVSEIAELTGSSPEAVRVNLSRARRSVRDTFLKIENYEG